MHQDDVEQTQKITQHSKLVEQIDGIGAMLRWLWTTNLLASIVAIVAHQYIGAAIAAVTSIVSLFCTAATRRTRRSLESATCRDDAR